VNFVDDSTLLRLFSNEKNTKGTSRGVPTSFHSGFSVFHNVVFLENF